MDALQFMRDHQAYFEDYVTRSTYHSNAIEGRTLSFAETYAILWNDNTLKVTATARELYEAINHKYALAAAVENMEESLSERLVKAIAHDINRNISGVDDYRHGQVIIRGAEHLPPAANQVNQLMMQLVYEYNHDEGRILSCERPASTSASSGFIPSKTATAGRAASSRIAGSCAQASPRW